MTSGEGWATIERPGYFGANRDQIMHEWTKMYQLKNWRLVWRVGEVSASELGAYALYEDAYYEFLRSNSNVLRMLVHEASDVYDTEISNVESGLDYTKQEGNRTHLQDIAIRRCLVRMGLRFRGTELIRIRQEQGNHELSMTLSPGRVPFHKQDLIVQPELEGWWFPGTVESFYQSNKELQVREEILDRVVCRKNA